MLPRVLAPSIHTTKDQVERHSIAAEGTGNVVSSWARVEQISVLLLEFTLNHIEFISTDQAREISQKVKSQPRCITLIRFRDETHTSLLQQMLMELGRDLGSARLYVLSGQCGKSPFEILRL